MFKNNYTEHYFQSVLCCWVMLSVFKRRHYDKALLILLTTFHHLRNINHPFFEIIKKSRVAFDEYPVENFHSILRGRTKVTDTDKYVLKQEKLMPASMRFTSSNHGLFHQEDTILALANKEFEVQGCSLPGEKVQ